MSHNINFYPIGRTGNLMFQAAACLGYAKKYGAYWGCPSWTREVPHFRNMFPGVPMLDGNFRRYNVTDPAYFNYRPIERFQGDTTFVGFFQSEKFFEGYHDDVRQMFKLDINSVDAVSIHVRRGDYVQNANSFPPITTEYINQAIHEMLKSTGITKFIVISDDPNWCRVNIKGPNTDCQFEFSQGRNEFQDLSLMASCSHHIIANSTFSWWGAWLGHNPNKIVVSPHYENWFGPGFSGSPPKDLIPSSWHQIKFR